MEQVAHTIHEDSPRSFPAEWNFESLWVDIDAPETWQEWATPFKTKRDGLGVTMCASWADLGTSSHWVPGRVSPFDRGSVRQYLLAIPSPIGAPILHPLRLRRTGLLF